MINRDFTIIRGNDGIDNNDAGIAFRFLQEQTEGDPVPIQDIGDRAFTFRTGSGKMAKSVGEGIDITDNGAEGSVITVTITKEDSVLFPASHVEEYQIEQVFESKSRTIIKGRLLFQEGGTFNDN